MDFYEVVRQAAQLLQHQGRLTYRTLQRQFDLDDEALDDLKGELLFSHSVADENEQGLVWTGERSEPLSDTHHETDGETRYHALLPDVIARLQRDRRVTYHTLKYIFSLDDVLLDNIRRELTLRQLAVDDQGLVLVWTGEVPAVPTSVVDVPSDSALATVSSSVLPLPPVATETGLASKRSMSLEESLTTDVDSGGPTAPAAPLRTVPDAERRQLTVMFCDLIGSTDLSGRLDPEDLREVVRAYQETAAEVIDRYEGHIAQYLGDGLLIYFGWPQAHENDAERAVYTGLEIPVAMDRLNQRLDADHGVKLEVRMGIHTGPVVVGEMGGGERHENLALGETPNIAARLEGRAQANTAVISPVTAQLVQRSFVLEEIGLHELKGVTEPMMLYTVVGPHNPDHRDLLSGGFEALVGRDEEIGLLLRRWEQSKDGLGQVVLLSGEAGIGKSSVVEGLRHHVHQEGLTRIAFRCSPYHTHSALYPIIEQLQQTLGWQPDTPADAKLAALEQALEGTNLSLEEAVPLLASLLSLPLPEEGHPALTLNPQQQRQRTHDALLAWLLGESERQPVVVLWEDLHWADPSTLELLGLVVDQTPTVSMLHLCTFRPEFEPPWPTRSHITPIVLNRLERTEVEALMPYLARHKSLPAEVVAHIVNKTDGVPLFVEELTKMFLESELLREESDRYVLTGPIGTVSIPETLQDSLMARLDQMQRAKEVAQLGAVVGREFSYEMLQSISPQDEDTLQTGLRQLVETELLYQRGRPPRAKYIFKHALIQDAAYQSLLRHTRQHSHLRIAQTLEAQFPEMVEAQPELVAQHYSEAGCTEQGIAYWQQAGQRASERSDYVEALSHLTTGLTLLQTLPEAVTRHQQELSLQTAIGTAQLIVNGHAAPGVEAAYTRAHLLCREIGETEDIFLVLFGLWRFYVVRPDLHRARQLGNDLLEIAEQSGEARLYVLAHQALGLTAFCVGEFHQTCDYLEGNIAHDATIQQYAPALQAGLHPSVICRIFTALSQWIRGWPDQALTRMNEALEVATQLDSPFTYAYTHIMAAIHRQFRHDAQEVHDHALTATTLSTVQGFSFWPAWSNILGGWALTAQGSEAAGLSQMRRGLTDFRASGAEAFVPYWLGLLAEGSHAQHEVETGLDLLKESFEVIERTGQGWYEAELHRLNGALLLQQSSDNAADAETCFQQAITIAQSQSAKFWELRAATSLARLWQSQGKRGEAHDLLAPVYEWFTEGFDTADLIDAKVVLAELSEVAS